MSVLSAYNFCENCTSPVFYPSLIQDNNLKEVFNFEATCYVYVLIILNGKHIFVLTFKRH